MRQYQLKIISGFVHQHAIVLLALISVIGGVLRFSTLIDREFWFDEAYTGLLILQDWGAMLSVIQSDVHPPLYFAVLKIWASIFGSGEYALRSFSAILGTALIPLTYLMTQRLWKDRRERIVPLAAALIVAVNPFFVAYSQEVRAYALVAVLMTLAATFFFHALHATPGRFTPAWGGVAICCGLAFLTHYLSIFGTLTMGMLWCLHLLTHRAEHPQRIRSIIYTHIPTIVIGVLIVVPWLPSVMAQYQDATPLVWIPQARLSFIFRSIAAFLFGVDAHALGIPPVRLFTSLLSPSFVGFVIALVVIPLTIYLLTERSRESGDRLFSIFFLWLFPILLVVLLSLFGIQHWYVERYLITYSLFFLVYVCVLFREYRSGAVWLVLLIYIGALFSLAPLAANLGYRPLAHAIQTQYPTARIITTDPYDFFILRYYLRTNIKLYDANNTHQYSTWDMTTLDDILQTTDAILSTDIIVTQHTTPPPFTTTPLQSIEQFTLYTYEQ